MKCGFGFDLDLNQWPVLQVEPWEVGGSFGGVIGAIGGGEAEAG